MRQDLTKLSVMTRHHSAYQSHRDKFYEIMARDNLTHFSAPYDRVILGGNNLPVLIYISGPIQYMPDLNKSAFGIAARDLSQMGYYVCDPLDLAPNTDTPDWVDFLERDLHEVLNCSGVAMLENSENSPGAAFEKDVAQRLRKPTLSVRTWITLSQNAAPFNS